MTARLLAQLAWWTALAASAELLLLRMGTRTFVHIPGVDLLSGPLSVIAESGRLAFYSTVVLLALLLGLALYRLWAEAGAAMWAMMGGIGLMIVSALLAGAETALPSVTGWMSVGAIGLVALATTRAGWVALPLLLWATALGLNATGTLLQGRGGGLEGGQVGALVLSGDLVGLMAAISLPLLLWSRPSRRAWTAGAAAAAIVTGMLLGASSTTTILVLWSFGSPAALPPLLYGVGAGAAVTIVWSALERHRRVMAAAVILLGAGGLSLISTYQTTLVVAGLTLAGMELLGRFRAVGEPGRRDEYAGQMSPEPSLSPARR